MVDKMDLSLDDLISENRKNSHKVNHRQRGGRRGGGAWRSQQDRPQRGRMGGPYKQDQHLQVSVRNDRQTTSRGARVVVSNLHYEVSQEDIQVLFSSVGELKSAKLQYDNAGRSLGIANLVFASHEDAMEAYRQYNMKTLDGQPMTVIVQEPKDYPSDQKAPSGSILSRLGSKPGNIMNRLGTKPGNPPKESSRWKRGRGGASFQQRRKPLTADDLDAEMDNYMNADDVDMGQEPVRTVVNYEDTAVVDGV